MSEKQLSPSFTISSSESPLDLTVKRPDMDPNTYLQKPCTATVPQPYTSQGYSTYHESDASRYFETDESYTPMYTTDVSPPIYGTPQGSPSSPHTMNISEPPSRVYSANQRRYDQVTWNSSILPKKRKNLWRPYDSRKALVMPSVNEKDGESESDSGSNSSSDQDFKTPHTPMDPMKRRKRNMLQYAEDPLNYNNGNTFNEGQSCSSSSQMRMKASPVSQFNNAPISDHTCNYAMSRESTDNSVKQDKLIPRLKNRDIFGWSLKLTKPPQDVSVESDTDAGDSPNVCKDGGKTYFELQTVKQNNPIERSTQSINRNTPVKQENSKYNIQKQNAKQTGSQGKSNTAIKKQSNETETNIRRNSPSCRVYIQRRDNVIESFDETQNIPPKKEAKKTVSLIDLIEEIEADALKHDEDEAEKTKQRNNVIVKLLEQCNYVKLQALDYLMANVLIQDKEPSFKNKNETVQKMLKGDRIGSVNMLDVVELQVEMGLN